VAWPQRHNPDELTAIQHAMNLKLDQGESAFWAEYQNEPLPETMGHQDMLSADVIAAKSSRSRQYSRMRFAPVLVSWYNMKDKLVQHEG
jgi:hypothetical protein